MENGTKLIEVSSYIFMFCAAITILLFFNRTMNNLIVSTKTQVSNQNILYESERSYEEVKESKVSYAEVISLLLGNLEYDIQINDLTILKEGYNYQEFDFSLIPQAEFIKSYQCDSSGSIVKVLYKS